MYSFCDELFLHGSFCSAVPGNTGLDWSHVGDVVEVVFEAVVVVVVVVLVVVVVVVASVVVVVVDSSGVVGGSGGMQ